MRVTHEPPIRVSVRLIHGLEQEATGHKHQFWFAVVRCPQNPFGTRKLPKTRMTVAEKRPHQTKRNERTNVELSLDTRVSHWILPQASSSSSSSSRIQQREQGPTSDIVRWLVSNKRSVLFCSLHCFAIHFFSCFLL